MLLSLVGCNLENKISPLEARIAALEKQVEQLEFQVRLQSEVKDWDQVAYLTPSSDGYTLVKMDLGNLTVSFANVMPYANGSKVSLMFGNLTSATIDGLSANIE